MGRFYNTAIPSNIHDFIYQPPWELINKIMGKKQTEFNAIKDSTELLKNSLNIQHLDFDKENVDLVKNYYSEKINNLASAISQDPDNYMKFEDDIKSLIRALDKDKREGLISVIEGRYQGMQNWQTMNQFIRDGNSKEGINADPLLYNNLYNYTYNNLKNNTSQNPFTIFSPTKGSPAPNFQDETMLKFAKEIEDNDRMYQNGAYDITEKYRLEAKIIDSMTKYIMSNTSNQSFLNQAYMLGDRKFINEDGSLVPLFLQTDSKGTIVTDEQAQELLNNYNNLSKEEKEKTHFPLSKTLNPNHGFYSGLSMYGDIFSFNKTSYKPNEFSLKQIDHINNMELQKQKHQNDLNLATHKSNLDMQKEEFKANLDKGKEDVKRLNDLRTAMIGLDTNSQQYKDIKNQIEEITGNTFVIGLEKEHETFEQVAKEIIIDPVKSQKVFGLLYNNANNDPEIIKLIDFIKDKKDKVKLDLNNKSSVKELVSQFYIENYKNTKQFKDNFDYITKKYTYNPKTGKYENEIDNTYIARDKFSNNINRIKVSYTKEELERQVALNLSKNLYNKFEVGTYNITKNNIEANTVQNVAFEHVKPEINHQYVKHININKNSYKIKEVGKNENIEGKELDNFKVKNITHASKYGVNGGYIIMVEGTDGKSYTVETNDVNSNSNNNIFKNISENTMYKPTEYEKQVNSYTGGRSIIPFFNTAYVDSKNNKNVTFYFNKEGKFTGTFNNNKEKQNKIHVTYNVNTGTYTASIFEYKEGQNEPDFKRKEFNSIHDLNMLIFMN